MSDLMNAIIAAKLMGNGGGGGGGGLPPITTDSTTILPEQSITLVDEDGVYVASIQGQYPIVASSQITTVWDGVAYNCTMQELDDSPVWGNLAIVGQGADTGEPFMMMYENDYGITVASSSGGSHIVELKTIGTQTPPDGYILGVDGGEWKAVPGGGGAIYLVENENHALPMTFGEIEAAIENGSAIILKRITVFEGGTEYEFLSCGMLVDQENSFSIGFPTQWDSYSYVAATKNDYPVLEGSSDIS